MEHLSNIQNGRNSVFDNFIERHITPEELAKRLGISRKTIYRWVYDGILVPVRIGPGRLLRFPESYIENWISKYQ